MFSYSCLIFVTKKQVIHIVYPLPSPTSQSGVFVAGPAREKYPFRDAGQCRRCVGRRKFQNSPLDFHFLQPYIRAAMIASTTPE